MVIILFISQEVVRGSSINVAKFVLLWSWIELEERVFHEFVHLHYGCFISASVAVIGRRKHSDHISVVGPVVAVHYELVGSRDQFKVIRVIELFRNVLTEGVSSTSWRDPPAQSVVWV